MKGPCTLAQGGGTWEGVGVIPIVAYMYMRRLRLKGYHQASGIYKRVVISQVEASERVGESIF